MDFHQTHDIRHPGIFADITNSMEPISSPTMRRMKSQQPSQSLLQPIRLATNPLLFHTPNLVYDTEGDTDVDSLSDSDDSLDMSEANAACSQKSYLEALHQKQQQESTPAQHGQAAKEVFQHFAQSGWTVVNKKEARQNRKRARKNAKNRL